MPFQLKSSRVTVSYCDTHHPHQMNFLKNITKTSLNMPFQLKSSRVTVSYCDTRHPHHMHLLTNITKTSLNMPFQLKSSRVTVTHTIHTHASPKKIPLKLYSICLLVHNQKSYCDTTSKITLSDGHFSQIYSSHKPFFIVNLMHMCTAQ